MLKILFTIDTEFWLDHFNHDKRYLRQAIDRYVYGKSPSGDYGIGLQAKILNDNGLKGCFFVESLCAHEFGVEPLAEIVDCITESKGEVQLHLHTEWNDEKRASKLIIPDQQFQNISDFSLDNQDKLIALGLENLKKAGAS